MKNHAITKSIEAFGGQAEMARALGVTAPTVNQWLWGSRPIPVERCIQIEEVTGGRVRCEHLRPDVNWSVLRNTQAVDPSDPPHQEHDHPSDEVVSRG